MKKLLTLLILVAITVFLPLSANAAPTSKFKQFIIPLECTVDIINIGPGDPYASIQPEDCEDPDPTPPDIPTPPTDPGFDNLLLYYPGALSIDDFDLDGYESPGGGVGNGIGFDFDEFKSSFVIPMLIILFVILLFALLVLLYGRYHRRRQKE